MYAERDGFNGMYIVTDRQRKRFGSHWVGPNNYEHGKETLVARYEKVGGDGLCVEIYVISCPAIFYIVKALPSKNSVGKDNPGFTLSTGSGLGAEELVISIADAITNGMLGLVK